VVGWHEVGEPAAIAAEMCVFAVTLASVVGASVQVSVCWRLSFVDVPYPAFAEVVAVPGFVVRLVCPAVVRTSCLLSHSLS
jgi:hypothetical protein